MIDWSHPLVVGIPGFLFAGIGLWLAFRKDKSTESAAVIAAQTGSVAQVIAGLNKLIENLQDDNKVYRENFKELTVKLVEVIKERDQIQKDYNALAKKYGVANG